MDAIFLDASASGADGEVRVPGKKTNERPLAAVGGKRSWRKNLAGIAWIYCSPK